MYKKRNRQSLNDQLVAVLMLTGLYRALTKVNDKLHNLKTSNPLLPPYSDPPGALKVVPIHDNMDKKIEGDGYP